MSAKVCFRGFDGCIFCRKLWRRQLNVHFETLHCYRKHMVFVSVRWQHQMKGLKAIYYVFLSHSPTDKIFTKIGLLASLQKFASRTDLITVKTSMYCLRMIRCYIVCSGLTFFGQNVSIQNVCHILPCLSFLNLHYN